MDENKSSISNARSYEEMGEFWDNHDTSDYWDQMETVEFEIDLSQERFFFYPLEKTLASKLKQLAQQHGVSAETLLNLWVQEKVLNESTSVVAMTAKKTLDELVPA